MKIVRASKNVCECCEKSENGNEEIKKREKILFFISNENGGKKGKEFERKFFRNKKKVFSATRERIRKISEEKKVFSMAGVSAEMEL
jgi:hypothetical protein